MKSKHIVRLLLNAYELNLQEAVALRSLGSELTDKEREKIWTDATPFFQNTEMWDSSTAMGFANMGRLTLGAADLNEMPHWACRRSAMGPGYLELELAGNRVKSPHAILELVRLFGHGLNRHSSPIIGFYLDAETDDITMLFHHRGLYRMCSVKGYLGPEFYAATLPPFDHAVWQLKLDHVLYIEQNPAANDGHNADGIDPATYIATVTQTTTEEE